MRPFLKMLLLAHLLLFFFSAWSFQPDAVYKYSLTIEAQPLGSAITALAEQTGLQIVANYEDVKVFNSITVKGSYTPAQALDALLARTGLVYQYINSKTIAVVAPNANELSTMLVSDGDAQYNSVSDHNKPQETALETIIVTAQRRQQNLQEVPISMSVISDERLGNRFFIDSAVSAFSLSVPSLYAESSSGRTAPRFYLRGLGNADFNQAASQPVSIVYDDIILEKSGIKSFPLFDIQSVEVLRGPQGSLYGRNTTAGIINIVSRKPTAYLEGYAKLSLAQLNTAHFEAAVSGPLLEDVLEARLSILSQHRGNYIDNDFTQQSDVIGSYHDTALRLQLQWQPMVDVRALLIAQHRSLSGNSSTLFRANTLSKGSNRLNENFERFKVNYDGGGNQKSEIEHSSVSLHLEKVYKHNTLSSISSFQTADRFGRADVDGGFGAEDEPGLSGPGIIPFSVDTGSFSNLLQFTQEFRIKREINQSTHVQAGAFYFYDDLDFIDLNAKELPQLFNDMGISSTTRIKNEAWALFAQANHKLSESWRITAGLRFTDDYKRAFYAAPPSSSIYSNVKGIEPAGLRDRKLSWDISVANHLSSRSMAYARLATAFRGPTFQTSVRQGLGITAADSETVLSFELGLKSMLSNSLRINTSLYYYTIDSIQLTEVGGKNETGGVSLANADEGLGYGGEIEAQYALTANLKLSAGFALTHTAIRDVALSSSVCEVCTVIDPINQEGRALIDGNPFQHVPKWTFNSNLEYTFNVNHHRFFFYTEWRAVGPTNDFLYESIEFRSDTQFEGMVRLGWRSANAQTGIAMFVMNLTDEINVIGGVDFNNLTTYVNEPRTFGITLSTQF